MNKQTLKNAEERFSKKTRWIAQATAQSLHKETTEEQEKRIEKLLSPRNYARFFDYYFGLQADSPLSDAPSASFHTAAYKELLRRPVLTQFRLWFRGAAKSTQTNVGNAFALKCKKELRFMLLVASSGWRAKLLLADLQAQLEANKRIIHDFGHQMQYGHWRDGAFETQDGCYFMGLGINQPFRGLRRYANRIDFAVVDDIEDRKRVTNSSLILSRVDKLLGELGGAFHKERQRWVISNNYITRKGVIAGLLQRLKGKTHVHISRVNLTDEQGESTWPAYYQEEDVQRIHKKYDTYTLQREYYNRPVEQEKVFKAEWVRFAEMPRAPKFLVGFWDLSYSARGDYKAFVLLGLCKKQWYVMEIFCRKCNFTEAMDWYFELQERLAAQGLAAYMYYDAMVAQAQVFDPLFRQEAEKRNTTYPLPLPYKQLRVEKNLRIEITLTAALFQGHLYISKHLKDQADTQTAIEQLLGFEQGSGMHDDFPDALAAALQIGEAKRRRYSTLLSSESYIIKKRSPAKGF